VQKEATRAFLRKSPPTRGFLPRVRVSLAEAQGGTVTYTPEQPRGAVFTLRLPGVPT
jgi:hypothetical protein